MATGGTGRIYEEDDPVDEYLLNQLSKWIIYYRLPSLARDLEISDAEISRIMIPARSAEEQIFKVLSTWYKSKNLLVRDLIVRMVAWQPNKYLDSRVWEHFQSKINPAALPADLAALQLQAPPIDAYQAQVSLLGLESEGCHPPGTIVRRTVTEVILTPPPSNPGSPQDVSNTSPALPPPSGTPPYPMSSPHLGYPTYHPPLAFQPIPDILGNSANIAPGYPGYFVSSSPLSAPTLSENIQGAFPPRFYHQGHPASLARLHSAPASPERPPGVSASMSPSNVPHPNPHLCVATSPGRSPGIAASIPPNSHPPVTFSQGVPYSPPQDHARDSNHPPVTGRPMYFPNSSDDPSYLSTVTSLQSSVPTPNTLTPPSSAPTSPERFATPASSSFTTAIGMDLTPAPPVGSGTSSTTSQAITPSPTPDISLTNVACPSVVTSSMTSSRSSFADLSSPEDLEQLKRRLKESLIDRCKNYMSTDWLPQDDAKTIPVQGYYTEPCWNRIVKRGLQDRKVLMKDGLYEIFNEETQKRKRILAEGKAGSGKSSAMAKLAIDWADDDASLTATDEGPSPKDDNISSTAKLKQFDFVFLIELKYVNSDVSLETVIMEQHEFDNNDIAEDHISAILKSSKTLLIFDGYDEYKKGTNSAIDAAITGKRGNSFVLITSRPDYMEKKDRNKLDGQIQIWGLSHKSIREYAERFFDSEEKSHDLCKKAKDAGIFDSLRTPIILLMMCLQYIENKKLPESKADAVWKLIEMYIKRAREKGIEFENTEEMLLILGELSWEALQKDTHQLLIKKEDVENKSPDLLRLGLLLATMSPERARVHKVPKWLTLPHKIFQDVLAGYFMSKRDKVALEKMLPSWRSVMRHFEVVKMACVLMDDPSSLIELVCQKFVENAVHNMRRRLWYGRVETLKEFAQELKGKFLDPLCNSQFYYVTELPLRRRSRMYVFEVGDKPVSDEQMELDVNTSIGPCVICIEKHNAADQEVLETISNLNQPITDLFADNLEIEYINHLGSDLDKSENGPLRLDSTAGSIRLKLTKLPLNMQKHLGQQLASGKKLEILEIPELPLIVDNLLNSVHTKKQLKLLNISNCNLSEEQFISICEQIKRLPCLVSINVGKNKMSSQSLMSLTESLRSWGSRQLMLFLYQCDIYSSSCTELLKVLSSCTGLQKLDISGNPVGGAFAALHPRLVYPALMELETRFTPLSGTDIQALGAIMRNNGMPQLWKLQLGYNSPRYPRKRLFTRDAVGEALGGEPKETLEALRVILEKVKDVELWVGVHKIEMKKVDMELARKLQVMLGKVA